MSSIIKVNTVQDADGNNIINESGDVITVGAAGDTVTVAGNVVKSNALQASDAGNIVSQSGTTITVGASGDTVALASGASQTGFGSNAFRNIVINGDMSIAQRNTSVTSITSGAYRTADRMYLNMGTAGTWTNSISTDVPTGQGFAKSFKLDCTTANASLSSGSYMTLQHRIEAQNLQYIKKGTANAESLTLSFWVKSAKTGTYVAYLKDDDNNRDISKSYTISSANTWEKKTITFPPDTTGALNNDNGIGLYIYFWLVAGSTYLTNNSSSLQTTWASSANSAAGQVNLADSTSNDWYITGIQLETGTSATDFEHLPLDINLTRCQRYYEKNFDLAISPAQGVSYAHTQSTLQATAFGTTNARIYTSFKTNKRTTPSATFYYVTGIGSGTGSGKWSFYNGSSWSQSDNATGTGEIDEKGVDINISHSSMTVGYTYLVGGGWSVDCEL